MRKVIIEHFNENLLEYLTERDIAIVDVLSRKIDNIEITEQVVNNQLFAVTQFHKKMEGYSGLPGKRLSNATGRLMEQCKIDLKKLKRFVKNIDCYGAGNTFEELLLEKAPSYVERAEVCIRQAFNAGYIDLISRSMKRNEICLGDVDFDNLWMREKIEIVDTSKCAYNMVEIDALLLLNKLKRKGIQLSWEELIGNFCEDEELGDHSKQFIFSLLSYPYQFIKISDRYRRKSKEWTEEEYVSKLLKAVEQDGAHLM